MKRRVLESCFSLRSKTLKLLLLIFSGAALFAASPVESATPLTLVSGLSNPHYLALDADNVYWTDNSGVYKISINGGSAVTLVSLAGGYMPQSITVDSADVYYGACGAGVNCIGVSTLNKVGKSGGAVTTLASGLSYPQCVQVDSTNIYWADTYGASGVIKKTGLSGGTVTSLVSGQNYISEKIAIDSTDIYWVERYGNTIKKMSKSGGLVTTLASGLSQPYGIAIDSAYVYWTEYDGGTVKKVAKTGGPVTTLATGLYHSYFLAVDSANVYWTEFDGGTLKRVGINGGAVTTLATGLDKPSDIAVDSTSVYWTEWRGGTVKKMAKNDSIALPRTGQTTSYAAGDDGDIQAGVAWPDPRFTDNGDQTITDNLTGLIWTEDAGTPTVGSCTGGQMDWQAALDYVACLNTNNYLGHNDWRLPNVNELESLVDAEQANPSTWLNIQGFSNVGSDAYWSSSSDIGNGTVIAWIVSMWNGYVGYSTKTNSLYVWPVHGRASVLANLWKTGQTTCYDISGSTIPCSGTGQDGDIQAGVEWPNPRFTVSGDCVADNLTGLMWVRNPDSAPMAWLQALDYANSLDICGYTDWRLPNRKELRSLINYGEPNAAAWLNTQGFTNVGSGAYTSWSSTTSAYVTHFAWKVHTWDGSVFPDEKTYNNFSNAWPVRNGTIITQPDTTPDPFIFTDQTGVALNTTISSNTITVSAINAPSLISITGGEYSVSTDGGTTWSAFSSTLPGTVSDGHRVRVRQTSSSSYSASTDAILTIGGVSDTFSVTTMAAPGVVPPGTGVPVTPVPGIDLTFDNVTTGGEVTVTEFPNPTPPANFRIVGGTSYDINFTGTFTGNVTVCINYDEADVQGNENNLKLFHRGTSGWEDITTTRDTVNNIVCGQTLSFSEFAVIEPLIANLAARFYWTPDTTITLKVNFDASASTCPTGHTCTYSWDFESDGVFDETNSVETTSKVYGAAGTYIVTLEVTDTTAGVSARAQSAVIAKEINSAPTAAKTMKVGRADGLDSDWKVEVTDASTDAQDGASALRVTVTWGDGTATTQDAGTVFTKTYVSAGTYTITHRVVDSKGWFASTANVRVKVPAATYSVSGRVTLGAVGLEGVAIHLKDPVTHGTRYLAVTDTSGNYTVNGIAPGTYDIVSKKAGYSYSPASYDAVVISGSISGKDFAATDLTPYPN